MSFILYVVVLVVSISSVMMGLDWLASPPPSIPKSAQVVSAPAKPVAPVKTAAAVKTTSTKTTDIKTAARKPASQPVVATTGEASATTNAPAIAKVDAVKQPAVAGAQSQTIGTTATASTSDQAAGTSDNTLSVIANAADSAGTDAQANAAPRCDVQACSARYHSFSAADCTYQPFDGPRRLCTVGHPPQQASSVPAGVETSDASQPPASSSSSCNVQACAAAYHSFDAATCTYQPFDGPRRACTK